MPSGMIVDSVEGSSVSVFVIKTAKWIGFKWFDGAVEGYVVVDDDDSSVGVEYFLLNLSEEECLFPLSKQQIEIANNNVTSAILESYWLLKSLCEQDLVDLGCVFG